MMAMIIMETGATSNALWKKGGLAKEDLASEPVLAQSSFPTAV